MCLVFHYFCIGMFWYRYLYIAVLLPVAASFASAQEKADPTLPELFSQLESTEDEVVISALEKMGPICDQACAPVISDKLHSRDADVVKAACHAAYALADPHLAPALMDVVRNHPQDVVRIEALKALTRIGRTQDYETLLNSVDFKHADAIARQIIRSMPLDTARALIDKMAALVVYPALTTSVIHAYRAYPDDLFSALISLWQRGQSEADEKQILRAMGLISQQHVPMPLSNAQQNVFWADPDKSSDRLESIAAIQANRSTDDALQWLLAYGDKLSPVSMLDVIGRIHGHVAEQFINALFTNQDPDLNYQTHIAPYPELVNALLVQHGNDPHVQALAVEKLRTPVYAASALKALYNKPSDDASSTVLNYLGHHDATLAQTAIHIVGSHPSYWPALVSMIRNSPQTDSGGRIYAARWAAAMLVSKYREKLTDLHTMIAEATKCLAEPWRLHAEPSLWLLNALNADIQLDLQQFLALRPNMKIAWLQHHSKPIQSDVLNAAIRDKNPSVIAQTLVYISDETNIQPETEWIELIKQYIQSDNPLLSLNAILIAGKKQIQSTKVLLESRLSDGDPRIVYNAIWALQQLRSLPEMGSLSTIYYRASDGFLKKRLGFLTGLDPNRQEDRQMYEIETQMQLKPHQLYQMQFQERPQPESNIAIMRSDMAIQMVHTNLIGMFYTPGITSE